MTAASALTALRHAFGRHSVTILYVGIVVLCVVGFYQQGQRDHRQCLDAQVNREAARQTVRDVADLGRGFIEPGTKDPRALAARKQFDHYERTSLAKIPPIVCGRG